MDFLGYRLSWAQQEEGDKLPTIRIHTTGYQWDLIEGRHPIFTSPGEAFYARDPFADTQNPNISLEFQLRPMGCVHGHNTLADATYTSLVDVDVNIPISPLFVRDLCGRTIYIGYGPEEKGLEEWEAYRPTRADESGTLVNPNIPYVTFPKGCQEVTEDVQGSELIEQVFFAKWRTLDVALDFAGTPSGQDNLVAAGIYSNANLYPYKLRLDTFYTDGYKLPQTNMVFAKPDVHPEKTAQAVAELAEKWQSRPATEGYEAWFEANGGDDWFEALYQQGCTVIPTFEACNGFHVVDENFQLKDYWPGRFVLGLHDIVEERDDSAPQGTILEVVEPGYVTPTNVVTAKVVISNGRGYITPHQQDPVPLVPNLNLPHQRTVADWQATWLPTHPSHFEPPATWGWDADTGRFLQLRGPLWDPLHYYYECMDPILQAYKTPLEGNRWLVAVPKEMQGRFYPITEMVGFDVVSQEALHRRQERNTLPRSALTRVRDGKPGATLGYHPLPLQFEYELDSWWFPNLHPLNRMHGEVPEHLVPRMCPLIKSEVGIERYVESVDGPESATWLRDKAMLQQALGDPIEDYPQLLRYVDPDLPIETVIEMAQGLFLEDVADDVLQANPQEIWSEIDALDDLEELADGFYDAVFDMREEAVKLLRQRHEVYRENPAMYAFCWWFCVTPQVLAQHFNEWKTGKEQASLEAQKDSLRKISPTQATGIGRRKL